LAAGENASVGGSGSLRVLLVEDNPGDADLVREALEGDTGSWQIEHVLRLAEAVGALHARSADVVLLDLCLPDASGLHGVTQLVSMRPDVPLVVLTGGGGLDAGTHAVQQGAQEYLLKSELDRRVLGRVLRYSIERHAAAQRAQLFAREQAARAVAEESRMRAVLLADAGIAVASTLEEGQALAHLAHTLVPRFAACCAVQRIDVNGHGRCLLVVQGSSGASA
jgi:DNA-binding NtrC family response regulator